MGNIFEHLVGDAVGNWSFDTSFQKTIPGLLGHPY